MSRIILHVGDHVTHPSYGEGVVTIVDEDFCTIKFDAEELTFRLPDAFDDNFLTSQDAVYVPDEEEDEDWEEEDEEEDDEEEEDEEEFEQDTDPVKPAASPAPQANRLGCVGSLVALGIPMGIGLPIIYFFVVCYLDDGGGVFLVLGIISLLLMALFIYIGVRAWTKPLTPAERRSISLPEPGEGPDPGHTLLLGMMGGYLLGKSSHKHKSIFDSARDDLFWQEKARRSDGYDYDDDDGGW